MLAIPARSGLHQAQDRLKSKRSRRVVRFADEVSLSKSRRLKAAWEAKRKRASQEIHSARCPNWLNVSADRLHFVVNPERVEVIRRIYHLACTGQGVARIARTLNATRYRHGRGARVGIRALCIVCSRLAEFWANFRREPGMEAGARAWALRF